MRYRVYDEEDKKERILENCVTDLGEVGNIRKVQIKKNNQYEEHHFKVLEVLPDGKNN